MRELQLNEINSVSGAGICSAIGSGLQAVGSGVVYAGSEIGALGLGALTGASAGAYKVGVSGGNIGGILGLGLISAGVGVILGSAVGAIDGATYGLVNGWDKTASMFNHTMGTLFDPDFKPL